MFFKRNKDKAQYKTVLESIGNTPLARLTIDSKADILVKLEQLNPGGSIKVRPALFMIEEAERTGKLKPGGTIIEASSGNQGIALAMIGAAKGYKVIITVPIGTSCEKVATLKAYGARVITGSPSNDPNDLNSYHAKAFALLKDIPNSFMPNQYYNKQNPLAHYTTTGPEIWKQTNGKITHFFAGKGSCGTISGVGKYLKEKNPNITVIAVDEDQSLQDWQKHKTEGIGVGIESNLERSFVDDILLVSGECAFETAKALARDYGLLIGLSSGAVMHAVMQKSHTFSENDVVVAILADSGRAYLRKLFGC